MIIELLKHLASEGDLYAVHIDIAIAIPIVYSITLFVSILLREFTHGWIKYTLAVLFVGSFAGLTYILMLDYSPWQYIMPAIAVVGGVSGLWNWARDIMRDVKKL